MYYLFLILALMLVFVPSFLKRKRNPLSDEETVLVDEYKNLIKSKPFGKMPDDLTNEQRRMWSRAISEKKEIMNIRMYQIFGILIAVVMLALIIFS